MIFNSSTDSSSILMTSVLYSKVSQANHHTKQVINAVYFNWASVSSFLIHKKIQHCKQAFYYNPQKKLFTLWFTLSKLRLP